MTLLGHITFKVRHEGASTAAFPSCCQDWPGWTWRLLWHESLPSSSMSSLKGLYILRPYRIPPSHSINDNFNCRIEVTKHLAWKMTYSRWYYNPHCSSLSLVAMLVLCSGVATGQAHDLFLCDFQAKNHFHIFILYKKIERVVLWRKKNL